MRRSKATAARTERWESRPVVSRVLRVAIFLIPLVAGFLVGALVARTLPDPRSLSDVITWWILVVAASSVTATVVDRYARRLLPLTWLLQMTMLFPDRAPSRFRVSRRTGNVVELKRRIAEAQEGGDPDLGEVSSLILSLATALSNHDRKTRGHSERTRAYTDMIAEEMALSDEDRGKLRWAALLHDVGKLEVPAEILNKNGALDDEEWHQIRRHPVAGMRLVAPLLPWLGDWAKTIEHHHERWDGTGYPYGLAGAEIALGARIVSVADSYDVMTAGRPYQAAKSPAAARAEIAKMANKQFDPAVVRALMSVSLGRLRWAAGPVAGVIQLPFLRGLPAFGRDAATVVTSGALMTTTLAAGLVTTVPTPSIQSAFGASPTVAAAASDPTMSPPDTATGPFSDDSSAPGDEIADGVTQAAGAGGRGADGDPESTTGESDGPLSEDPGGDSPGGADTGDVGGDEEPSGPPDPSAPTAGADTASTLEDNAVLIDVLANDTAKQGELDRSSLRVLEGADIGTVTSAGTRLRYTPATNESGVDSFRYQVCDNGRRCSTGRVTVQIAAVNDAPIPGAQSASLSEDGALELPLGVTDVEGDALSCSMASGPGSGSATVGTNCDSLAYRPIADFHGADSVRIEVSDGTDQVVYTVAVAVASVNDAPVARPDSASTSWSSPVTVPVTANDIDVDGDTLVANITSGPAAGSASAVGGSVSYTPQFGESGLFTIGYQACDNSGACSRSNLTVTVVGVMAAADDTFAVRSGGLVSIAPLTNDVPGDGSLDRSTWRITVEPKHGTVRITGARMQYRADSQYVGTDSFTYEICDTSGSCDTATVTIVVSK